MTQRDKIRISATTQDRGGCCYYRLYLPYSYLKKRPESNMEGFISNFFLHWEFFNKPGAPMDVLATQNPMSHELNENIMELQEIGYIDIDDNYFQIDETNPCWWDMAQLDTDPRLAMIDQMNRAHTITCTNDNLKEVLSSKVNDPEKIKVIPNAIHPFYTLDEIKQQIAKFDNTHKIRIGYYGGFQHHCDWLEYVKPFKEFIKKNIDKVEVTFMGWCPNELLYSGLVKFVPWVHGNMFPHQLFNFPLDVVVAPLMRNKLNLSKSNIKYLETGMYRRCFLGENYGPYENLKDKETAVLFNGPEDMIKQLQWLVDNPKNITAIGKAAYDDVMENHTMENTIDQWVDVFKNIAKVSWNRTQCGYTKEETDRYESKIDKKVIDYLDPQKLLDNPCDIDKPETMIYFKDIK